MNAIEFKNFKKYFSIKGGLGGHTKAVDDVSFNVKKGELFGFLGPNGAGKTTTIRCLMDFLRPTGGSISVFGLDSKKDSVEIKKKIGYLSGDVKLYDKWTGEDHIKFVEKIRGESKLSKQLIKDFDFNPKVKFKSLSSGNKQKLGLILALMSEPEILVLDEPTSALDPLLQNLVYDKIKELNKKGATVFMSSHNLPEVERVCSKVGIIKNGKLVTTENIKDLVGKKIINVSVYFDNEYNLKDFNIKGIEIKKKLPKGLILTVKGDINVVLKQVLKYKVRDIEITHASLEDIFLEFYEK